MSPSGSILPYGIKASRQPEPEVVVAGSKNFADGSMGLVGEQLPFPPLHSCTHGYWLWENQHQVLDTDSEHIQPPGETCPSPAAFFYLGGSVPGSVSWFKSRN